MVRLDFMSKIKAWKWPFHSYILAPTLAPKGNYNRGSNVPVQAAAAPPTILFNKCVFCLGSRPRTTPTCFTTCGLRRRPTCMWIYALTDYKDASRKVDGHKMDELGRAL